MNDITTNITTDGGDVTIDALFDMDDDNLQVQMGSTVLDCYPPDDVQQISYPFSGLQLYLKLHL